MNELIIDNGFVGGPLLQKILTNLRDGLIVLDEKGRITYMNRAAGIVMNRQLIRKPKVGDELVSLVKEARREMARQHIQAAANRQTTGYKIHFSDQKEEQWLEVFFAPITGDTGDVSHIFIQIADITDRMQLQQNLEIERKSKRHEVLKAALDAQEKQRSEIGRELHDNVNQVLTTVKLYNEICLGDEKVNRNMLLRSVQQINYCIETLRALSKALSSPSVDEVGLKESIKELADSVDATMKMSVSYYSYGVRNESVTQELQTTIFRIAQEQLTNVLKYSRASAVEVMLVGTSSSIALSIKDNGDGFDPDEKRKGVGITNMISRAEAWGGQLEFDTAPGKGCTMMVEFPLSK